MRVLLIFLGFFSLNANQQLLNANIAIPLNSPRGFVLWIINHQFTIIDEIFKILKPRCPSWNNYFHTLPHKGQVCNTYRFRRYLNFALGEFATRRWFLTFVLRTIETLSFKQ